MKCRICDGEVFKQVFNKDGFSIQRCGVCGFGTLDHFPSKAALELFYDDETYHDDKIMIEHSADALKKMHYVDRLLRQTMSPPSSPHLLDYGCGTGDVMLAAKRLGYTVAGYDIAPTSATKAAKLTGSPVLSKPPALNLYKAAAFDVITVFDVIEHIADFNQTIAFWRHWLTHRGLLFITTPDLSSWDYRLFHKHWYGFTKIPQHLNYFDRSSMTAALDRNGFEPVRIKTWGFTRTLSFIASRLPCGSAFQRMMGSTGLADRTVYMPMIDMMVVAAPKL